RDVVERGRLGEPERVGLRVEQVRVALERRDQHDVEGQRREHREEGDRQVEGGAAEEPAPHALASWRGGTRGGGARDHHVTSLRRMRRKSTALTPPSTGSRNSAIAAPRPRLPPRMPVKNARLASVLVLFAGPPR